MLSLRKPPNSVLQRVLVTEAAADFSYEEVGATAGTLPSGYEHDHLTRVIGSGRAFFERAAEHLDSWGLQYSSGFGVYPYPARVEQGATALLTLRIGPAFFVASARVVYTVREPNRHGFAYGTLPTHPEVGEEYFGVSIDSNEVVRFELVAFSRPGTLARLGGPITRQLQKKALRTYGDVMAALPAGR